MKIIPKKQRIKVYKRALEIIENEEEGFDSGLCILLRDLYLNKPCPENNYKIMRFERTPYYFIEFKKYYNYDTIENFRFNELYEKNDNIWRRVVLRLILEELKANEEY